MDNNAICNYYKYLLLKTIHTSSPVYSLTHAGLRPNQIINFVCILIDYNFVANTDKGLKLTDSGKAELSFLENKGELIFPSGKWIKPLSTSHSTSDYVMYLPKKKSFLRGARRNS